jgi:two-component system, chemotaxis family, protein-glutamate methylesterase/glutaminase
MTDKIDVLIVDDSAVVRQVISGLLQQDRDINVLGAVADPLFAIERMKRQWPDVIVLDIEMPRMNGIDFLKKIMSERPTPVVICSSQTEKGAAGTIQALSAGAVDIVTKPKVGADKFLLQAAGEIIQIVKAAARANVRNLTFVPNPKRAAPVTPLPIPRHANSLIGRVVAIGASTGGTQALEVILSALPVTAPGIVIVQHMPEKFTALFAERLDSICTVEVREAQNGDQVLPGHVLIAPGGHHMLLKPRGPEYCVEVMRGPHVNRHCPSVDVLFRSVARYAGANAVGILLTGMGDDGARGLKEMRDTGAFTVAQDESTSVVYGMPKEAVSIGAAQQILPLPKIAETIMLANEAPRGARASSAQDA